MTPSRREAVRSARIETLVDSSSFCTENHSPFVTPGYEHQQQRNGVLSTFDAPRLPCATGEQSLGDGKRLPLFEATRRNVLTGGTDEPPEMKSRELTTD